MDRTNPRISIIVPFFNVEAYISDCLESIYNQDIPEREYEVICVNDASLDGSREIVIDYQKRHGNLILVEHEVNQKLGAARNTGRKIARGRYVWNVDSDDRIAANCLSDILAICENDDLDVLLFGFGLIVDNKTKASTGYMFPSTDVTDGLSFFHQYGKQHIDRLSVVWKQVFRRQFLDDNGIYSPEINMSEDVPFTFRTIITSQRMRVVDKPFYYYRLTPNSIGDQIRKTPSALASYESCFIAARDVFLLSDSVIKIDSAAGEAIRRVGTYCFSLYRQYYSGMSAEQKMIFVRLCRTNVCKNSFVFRYIGCRMAIRYVQFLISAKNDKAVVHTSAL